MKKIIGFIVITVIGFFAFGCDKQNDLVFEHANVTAKSSFDESVSFSFEDDNISQVEDQTENYDYFYSKKTMNEFKQMFEKNEYLIKNDKLIRFLKEGQYFTFELVSEEKDYSYYKLASERVVINNEQYYLTIPFLREYGITFDVNNSINISEKEVIFDYFSKLNYSNMVINENSIIFSDLICLKTKTKHSVSIIFDSSIYFKID